MKDYVTSKAMGGPVVVINVICHCLERESAARLFLPSRVSPPRTSAVQLLLSVLPSRNSRNWQHNRCLISGPFCFRTGSTTIRYLLFLRAPPRGRGKYIQRLWRYSKVNNQIFTPCNQTTINKACFLRINLYLLSLRGRFVTVTKKYTDFLNVYSNNCK